MKDRKPRGIILVSYPIESAFNTPISNLSTILRALTETYVIIGTYDPSVTKKKCNSIEYTFFYESCSSIFSKLIKFEIMQFQILYKIFYLRKNYNGIIFFMEFPPLLPMIIGKLLNKNIHWLFPSKISIFLKSHYFKIIKIISKLCYYLCTHILLYSPRLISEWHLTPHRHKILIAHRHFLDFTTFTITTFFPERPPLIGYIGRLSAEKGVQHFVQALPAILSEQQDLRVLIGGDGQLKESIEKSLDAEKITARVDLPGWISHEDLPNYLNQLRLLVLPSYTEGLPNIMLEAMACGTPVLATPVGAIPDVIRDGETGFIMEDNSPECIARNLLRALHDPDLEGVAERGRRFVEREFTFEKAVERWKGILEDVE